MYRLGAFRWSRLDALSFLSRLVCGTYRDNRAKSARFRGTWPITKRIRPLRIRGFATLANERREVTQNAFFGIPSAIIAASYRRKWRDLLRFYVARNERLCQMLSTIHSSETSECWFYRFHVNSALIIISRGIWRTMRNRTRELSSLAG